METVQVKGPIVPTPGPAKVIGLLSVIFGSIVLLWHGMGIAQAAFMPYYVDFLKGQQKAQFQKQEASHQAEIVAARQREEAAKTPAERLRFEAERKALEAAPPIPALDMTAGINQMNQPSVASYTWGTHLTGLLAYGAMLASGIGLLRRKEWGRKLGLWDAWLNLARIALLTGLAVTVVAPLLARNMATQMEAQQAALRRGGAGPPAGMPDMGKIMAITMAVTYAGMGVMAAIYPIVTIFVLGRKGVRAACEHEPGPWLDEP